MALLVGIVGALVGFTVGVVLTEVVLSGRGGDWPNVVPFALGVLGWLAAREAWRHRHGHGATSPTA